MAMVDEKWGRNQQVAAYDSFAILRPRRRGERRRCLWALSRAADQEEQWKGHTEAYFYIRLLCPEGMED